MVGGRIRAWAADLETRWDRYWTRRSWERGFDHLKLLPFRGYAGEGGLVLSGRVLDDKLAHVPDLGDSLWQNLRATWRRFETDEIPGARVRLRVGDREVEAETDAEGYFRFEVPLVEEGLPGDGPVRAVGLEVVRPACSPPLTARARIHVPPPDCEFAVVSDLDDTVIRTGATSILQQTRVVVLNNARTRTPFEGVGGFYRALQAGPDGRGHNPISYVSSSPWNLYGLFEAFFDAHEIPKGPLFLKDYGLTRDHFFSSGHRDHKLARIEALMEAWPRLPFVLIGDSGQKDPEIYLELVRRAPARVRAVFIRDVSGRRRDRAVEDLAEEAEGRGVPMILAEETRAAFEAAAELGLVSEA